MKLTLKTTQTCMLALVLASAGQAGFAQVGGKLPAAPPAAAAMPTAVPSMGTAADLEIIKLKRQYAEDMAKLKTDIAALNDQIASLTASYKTHTHDYYIMQLGLVPTEIKCFDKSDCKGGMFYDKLIPNSTLTQVTKPHN